ncbi:MAG: Hpt domain-containing protein [Acidimicrobiia bacterium]
MVAPDTVPPRHSPAAPAASHGLDRTALARLTADVGVNVAQDICRIFLTDLPHRMATMEAAFGAGDAVGVARAAHGLTSAARLVGAAFLAELCAELDRQARTCGVEGAAAETFGMVGVAAANIAEDLGSFLAPRPGE